MTGITRRCDGGHQNKLLKGGRIEVGGAGAGVLLPRTITGFQRGPAVSEMALLTAIMVLPALRAMQRRSHPDVGRHALPAVAIPP